MFNGSTMMLVLLPVSMKDVLYLKRKLPSGQSLERNMPQHPERKALPGMPKYVNGRTGKRNLLLLPLPDYNLQRQDAAKRKIHRIYDQI